MNTLPNFFTPDNGFPLMNGLNGLSGVPNLTAGFLHNYMNVPNNIAQVNGEMNSLLKSHRRKLLRRAANRRSAQLSRARMRSQVEILKDENIRLQKYADMLDSQPDLVFCVNIEGKVNYISERTKNYVKTDESSEEDPSHMNQILTTESMDVLIETLNQLNSDSNDDLRACPVKEICYHDANGYPTVGYLRCTKIARTVAREGTDSNTNSDSHSASQTSQGPLKKAKVDKKKPYKSSSNVVQSSFEERNVAVQSSSSQGPPKIENSNSDNNTSEGSNGSKEEHQNLPDREDEFICVIRAADYSIPQYPSSLFQTYLSTASMVEHDRKTDQNVTHPHTNTTINITESNRGGSPSASLSNDSGSDDKFGSSGGYSGDSGSGQSSGNQVGTGTSSDTGSDESDSA